MSTKRESEWINLLLAIGREQPFKAVILCICFLALRPSRYLLVAFGLFLHFIPTFLRLGVSTIMLSSILSVFGLYFIGGFTIWLKSDNPEAWSLS